MGFWREACANVATGFTEAEGQRKKISRTWEKRIVNLKFEFEMFLVGPGDLREIGLEIVLFGDSPAVSSHSHQRTIAAALRKSVPFPRARLRWG
jgi:hypothetical protein